MNEKELKRKYKITGARSMARLVKEMRDAQKGFFRNKEGSTARSEYLKQAKKLEERVDRAVDTILKYSESE